MSRLDTDCGMIHITYTLFLALVAAAFWRDSIFTCSAQKSLHTVAN